jgi:hypothetical protein
MIHMFQIQGDDLVYDSESQSLIFLTKPPGRSWRLP